MQSFRRLRTIMIYLLFLLSTAVVVAVVFAGQMNGQEPAVVVEEATDNGDARNEG